MKITTNGIKREWNQNLHLEKWLPEIPDLNLDNDHVYWHEKQIIPNSVTQVIDARSQWEKKRHKETKHEWEPRGRKIHSCLEAFLRGRSYDPGEYADHVKHLVTYWLWDEWEAIACEYLLIDKRRGIAGSADAILRHKEDHRRIAIADLKTNRLKISKKDISPQLGGYVNLLNICWPELHVTDCFGIWSCPTETDSRRFEPIDALISYEGMRDGFFRKERQF